MSKAKEHIDRADNSRVVINVATLDSDNPIPIDYGNYSLHILKRARKYIPFLEGNDLFAETLLEARLLSPTTLSCVNSKVDYCIGRGVAFTDVEEDEAFTEWSKSVNKGGESFNDVVRDAIAGYIGDGNAFVELVRGRIGTTKFVKLFPLSFLDCRLAVPEEGEYVPTKVIKSQSFRRFGYVAVKDDQYVELPIYNGDNKMEWYKGENGNEHCVIYLKNKMKGYDWYGMPSNIASLPQQILEYKAARFNMDNFENNLVIGGAIVLKGNLTQEEADKIGKKIVNQHTGDGKRGRFAILASQNGIEDSKILQFEQQREGDYIEFDKRIEEKIIFANSWSKVLIDPDSTGLGSTGKQVREIFEIKNNTVIKPIQKYIIDKLITPVLNIVDYWTGSKFSKHKVSLQTIAPLSFMGNIDVNAVMTKDEGRVVLGLQERKDDSYIHIDSKTTNKENV